MTTGVNAATQWMKSSVFRRGAAIALLAVVVLAVALAVVSQRTTADQTLSMGPGTAWFSASDTGAVALLDGPTDLQADRIDSVAPGGTLFTVPAGTGAYVINRTAGTVTHIDGSTLTAGPAQPLDAHGDPNFNVVSNGLQTWVEFGGGDELQPVNPGTLGRNHRVLFTSSYPFSAVAMAPSGVVWAISSKNDTVTSYYGSKSRSSAVVQGASGSNLNLVGEIPVLTKVVSGEVDVTVLNAATGGSAKTISLSMPVAGQLQTYGSTTSPWLLVNSSEGQVLDVVNVDTGVPQPVDLRSNDHFGAAVTDGHVIYVPDNDSGKVALVRLEGTGSTFSWSDQAVGGQGQYFLYYQHGYTWYDFPGSENAGVIRPDGQVAHIWTAAQKTRSNTTHQSSQVGTGQSTGDSGVTILHVTGVNQNQSGVGSTHSGQAGQGSGTNNNNGGSSTTNPPASTSTSTTTTSTTTVSNTVTVPNELNVGGALAKAQLSAAGLTPSVVLGPTPTPQQYDEVYSQSLAAGTVVPKGAAIAISVGSTLTSVAPLTFTPSSVDPNTTQPFQPNGMVEDNQGDLYITDSNNNVVWKWPAGANKPVVFAGNGASGNNGVKSGPATGTELNDPSQLALDSQGDLFIADQFNGRVLVVNPAGTITSVLGSGSGHSGAGPTPAGSAGLGNPVGLAFAPDGTLYVGDRGDSVVYKIAANSRGLVDSISNVTLYAGVADACPPDPNNVPPPSCAGPWNGSATSAKLIAPENLSTDAAGDLYISDDWAGRVLMVTPNDMITSVAGGGATQASTQAIAASNVSMDPVGAAVDPFGNLFIVEYNNRTLDELTPNGQITAFSGSAPGPSPGCPNGITSCDFGLLGNVVFGPNAMFVIDPNNNSVWVME